MSDFRNESEHLDEFVLKAVMHDARRFVSGGLTVAEAVRRTCNGSWQRYRGETLRRLQRELNEAA
jgi:hypothetical protein